jgi:hypothetical protein
MHLKPILLAALAIFVPGMAHAQYQMVQPMLYHGPAISYRDHVAAQEAGRQKRQGAPVATADKASMLYRPDLAQRRRNLAAFVERSRAADPAAAKSLEQLFAQGDVIEMIGTELRRKALRTDDVADAYTVWWITAWLGSRGRTDDVSPATIKAVRAQAAGALGATAGFGGTGDAARQEMAESLLIQAAMIEAAVEQAKGNAEQLRTVGGAINQGAKQMGVDLTKLNLTENGFVAV